MCDHLCKIRRFGVFGWLIPRSSQGRTTIVYKKQSNSYMSETTGSVSMLKLVNISRPDKHDSFDTKAETFEHNVAWCSQWVDHKHVMHLSNIESFAQIVPRSLHSSQPATVLEMKRIEVLQRLRQSPDISWIEMLRPYERILPKPQWTGVAL